MGFIRTELQITGTNKSKTVLALLDSGAFSNYIRAELEDGETPEEIGFHVYEGERHARMANGQIVPCERVKFKELLIQGHTVAEPSFVIMKELNEFAIIGAELMQELGLVLDPRKEEFTVSPTT